MNEAVPKIEGHAAFYSHLKNGHVDKAQLIGLENDRFVEKILFGRKYFEAPIITSRICGICPTIHNITSIKAIEAACGIVPSPQTKKLRELMLCGQMIQSHSLHLYLLVAPDFVGASSSFELQKTHPELFKNAIELKKYADKIIETIGGRAVHPIASVPGGFKSYPEKEELENLAKSAKQIEEIAAKTLRLFTSFSYPTMKREIIYSSLHSDGEYAFYDGDIWTSAGDLFRAEEYNSYIYEEIKPYTHAKFGTLKGKEIMVGAMARYNQNHSHLNEKTKEIISELGIENKFDNPFNNILAQAIENYFFVTLSAEIISNLLKNGIKKEHILPPRKFGIGTGACEAPRGTLFHHYELDKEGFITKCDIITPTVQSLPALEYDMKKMGPLLNKVDAEEKNRLIEILIRAYDPCITCATH